MRHNRGFVITGNLLLSGVFFMLVGIFGFNFFSDEQSTTTISIVPQKNTFNIEEEIVIDVTVASRSPLNALSATLNFPPENMQVKEVKVDQGIIDLWVHEPTYSNEDGEISFTGGTTKKGGVVGQAHILSIVFEPIKSGNIELTFAHSLVLESDGKGTELGRERIDADFIVQELEDPKVSNVVKRKTVAEYTIKDTGPPKPDLNDDGEVGLADVSVFLPSLTGKYDNKKDFNQDGKVNLVDMSILMSKIVVEED